MSSKRVIYTAAFLQQNATANGDGEPLAAGGYAVATAHVRGTFSATVNWEGSLDGVNWAPILATNLSDGTETTTATASGLYRINLFGILFLRARISNYASGSITIQAVAIT